ncbi:endopeptidase La [Desulfohalobiaceae bacterium Ax17]|uniref:endopeptidase La n=1 Tax=Desulfovulcanus ferrireducens TaxID=2831190 RepID=UPI00207BA284|nr:endopeptidase La [Desulfovulcanus ferrireducens]MBT8764104.1 endopeptidase La [Desulfovulcanus ferrireducens]
MDQVNNFDQDNSPEEIFLPLMTLREVVMFPGSIVPLFVGREKSIKAIESALADYDKKIFLVAQKDPKIEKPSKDDLFACGCVSRVLQMFRLPDGTIKVLFEGLYRARIELEEVDFSSRVPLVRVIALQDIEVDDLEAEALVRATHEAIEEYGRINAKMAKETILSMSSINQPGPLADALMPHLKLDFQKKQEVLEEIDPNKRLEKAYAYLQGEIEVFSLEKKIKTRVKKQMEKNQREYYLSEQLKAIHKEMGRETDPKAELDELEEKVKKKNMPEAAKEKALEEIKKLRMMPSNSAEYTVVHNYVDWILALPWNELKKTEIDIRSAEKVLNEDHFGLEKPKERILEYLAVQSLVDKIKGPILCLVGPPGVGKTSLAKSVARAMQRDFVRLSLGGVRDEAEIRGHRRTYVGALPGKIIQSLKRTKYNNPVFCLDEIDKMSTDFRGDPSAALLEVLDPEQNYAFNDHYLDLDYDLSNIFFITTANSLHSIPLPLQDRMEIIKLPGYLETEKKEIARHFLWPKQLKQHGLTKDNVFISDGAILEIIRRYTREAGVRNLEREIASICRKVAKRLVQGGDVSKKVQVSKSNIGTYLGVPKVRHGEREEKPLVGVTTGLAWTEVGGELLLVEVALMPGTGKVEITGKLGEVMQESARAALSYVRSRSDMFGLRPDFYKEIDIHVHVPEGATPKDGPSAGITLATSLVSALLNLPVRNDLAMTGEITLRGRVLPIGGLREKLLAARRAMISEVIIPEDNERELKEVPENVLKGLKITKVRHMDEVLPQALLGTTPDHLFCGRENIFPLAQKLLKEEFRTQAQ